ncbi:acetolactate synthase large subunit [Oxobacter pfennigii]|uniref:Acetolactate synthase n=1 Tax=Oxobacter pfennigii TaxID=36849 RepID=A0A0P8YBT4_9CLOT|nr:biosynthetic-type acetolactate synthase large subunit [Oxobacter pfennigii]KPU44559.1 acetolactate synthase large subunit [Oxobacter pfennigii]
MIKTGAEILIECLKNEGVDIVFGYPGGQVIPLYDKLYDSDLRHILVRHEQGAAHAADGYARVTGKVGVCIATSGPGATNLVTGIATAYMDSIPIVAITGQVKSHLLGKDSFQEADIVGITMPIVKHSYIVKDIKELAATVKEAFYIARTGRPGPVIIDVPSDIQLSSIEYSPLTEIKVKGYCYDDNFINGNVDEMLDLIGKAQRPIIAAGGGIIASGAHNELLEFAEKLNIPVVTTLMAVGAFDTDHPLCLGMLGMHGTRYANYAVCQCDLFIAIGMRFDDRVTGDPGQFAKDAKKIQIDIDDAEIGKIVPVDMGIVGDAAKILGEALKRLSCNPVNSDRRDWINRVRELREEYPLKFEESGTLKPQYVIKRIYELTEGKAIITTDVGEHQMWAAQYNKSKIQRSFLTSGGLGTMGYGFPAAIGAQAAFPGKTVICISGDGSFQMNSQELMTAVRYNLPVIIAIVNNGYLGMVRQWQELLYNERYSETDIKEQPDFVKLAEAYGAVGMRVTKKEEVDDCILKAINLRKTILIDFVVDRFENVYPFVPAGSTLDNMIGG